MFSHSYSAMSFIINNDQCAPWPGLMKFPWGIQRSTQIETAVNEPSWNVRKTTCVTNDLIVVKPIIVPPTMSDLTGESQAKLWVIESCIWSPGCGRGDVRVFPIAPLLGSLVSNSWIGSHK